MTTPAHNCKISQGVILPITVNVVNLETNPVSMACNTFVWKVIKSSFSIDSNPVFIVRIIFSLLLSIKPFRIFSAKSFVLTLPTTICSMFSGCGRKIRYFTAVLANYRDFFFRIVLMKAWKGTKEFTTTFSRHYNKFFRTLTTLCHGFRSIFYPVIMTAPNRAKDLFSKVRFKNFFAKRACFFHAPTILREAINGQAKQ